MQLRALLGSFVLVLGCSKSAKEEPAKGDPPAKTTEPGKAGTAAKPADEPTPAADAKPAIPAMPELTGAFTCKSKDPAVAIPRKKDPKNPWQLPFDLTGCPTIPSIFGTATFGMDAAEAQKAAKGAKKIEGGSGYVYVGKHPFRQQFSFRFDDATGKLEKFSFKVDAEGFAALKEAWGEPLIYTRLSDKVHAWFNPAAKIKVYATEDTWDRANIKTKQDEEVPAYWVYVVQYSPLAELLGTEGLLAKPLIGKTVEEISTAHPGLLEVKSKEQNQAELDKLGLDKSTQAKAEALGVGKTASANMMLPETETNQYHTLVHGDWDGGKLEGYSFQLPYGKDEKLKAELLAQIAVVLGKPTEARKEDDQLEYTFKAANGLIVDLDLGILKEDWHLKVRAK